MTAAIAILRAGNVSDEEVTEVFTKKYDEYQTNLSDTVTWESIFGEWFLFSMITIMTIGYGNVKPTSPWGQGLCVLYGLFGIPLNKLFVNMIVVKFKTGLRKIAKRSLELLNSKGFMAAAIASYFVFHLGWSYFIPSAVFEAAESWSYLESLYYCFVSATTIGFGDYVSSVTSREFSSDYYFLQVLLMFAWILFGRSFTLVCMNIMSYLIGLLVLDKLDCMCHKRFSAKKQMSEISECVAELNWQLVKYRPENFTKWKNLRVFQNICEEDPQNLDKEIFSDLLHSLEDLQEAIREEVMSLEEAEKSSVTAYSDSDSDDSASYLRFKTRISRKLTNEAKYDTNWPTISSVICDNFQSSSRSSDDSFSSGVEDTIDNKPNRTKNH
ncbi:potassium channel subfamily K member 10 [Caerostris darwini]|uniref:Potassium channel subfamily K member 10 n=1 Tax=Caerostris darwini TaxID=1538125 RepID=A0AAV4PZ29_9ARAC|nr:potassium channel subfamily K member 10 [Caerostris darwini]